MSPEILENDDDITENALELIQEHYDLPYMIK